MNWTLISLIVCMLFNLIVSYNLLFLLCQNCHTFKPFLPVWCMVAPDRPIQSLISFTGKHMPLRIPYKATQPITTLAAPDRVVHGVQLGGVWVSDIASLTALFHWASTLLEQVWCVQGHDIKVELKIVQVIILAHAELVFWLMSQGHELMSQPAYH